MDLDYTHKIEDGLEIYSFPSAVNDNQHHYIDRDLKEGEPWHLCIVNFGDSLSHEDALTLKAEIDALCDFMAKLIAADQQEGI